MILRLKLDVSKLDKTAFFHGTKGVYCDLTLFLNDQPDQFGNDASLKQDLGKDRREEKPPYCGSGKIVSGGQPKQQAAPSRRQSTPGKANHDDFDDPESQIPF